jgi:hypothetical protein
MAIPCRSITAAFLLMCFIGLPAGAAAEPSPFAPRALARAVLDSAPAPPVSPPQPGSADSLANGALIGAIIGAAAIGVTGGVICKVLQEPGQRSCWVDGLGAAALGAAIGAVAGLTVDASVSRTGGVRVAVRSRF